MYLNEGSLQRGGEDNNARGKQPHDGRTGHKTRASVVLGDGVSITIKVSFNLLKRAALNN